MKIEMEFTIINKLTKEILRREVLRRISFIIYKY